MTPDVAARLADAIAEILGPACRSVILHGSLAAGGFRPGRSDLDLLAIHEGPLSPVQLDSLVRLVSDADLGDAAGLDLDVVTADAARHPTPTPPLELHVSRNDAGFEVESQLSAAPDLPAELSMARQNGRALTGTSPTAALGAVPAEWVVARGRHWLRTWQSLTDDEPHAAFMVLTACRIWRFAVENVHSPKTAAARWALTQDPSLIAVRQALQQYEGDPATVIDEPGIAAVLAEALNRTALT